MKKIVLLTLLINSFLAFADSNPQPAADDEDRQIIHKKCLLHGKVYQVIPMGLGECSYDLPKNSRKNINHLGGPHDPSCFSEIIKYKRR